MRNSQNTPQLNAGSMADIAFLLLIFFLVSTTIPNEKGIARTLPNPCPPGQQPCDVKTKERNVLDILINESGEILINEEEASIDQLTENVMLFIENNGDGSCSYCNGNGLASGSENPLKAVLFLRTHRAAPYFKFIAVQNQISKAYSELREEYAQNVLKKDVGALTEKERNQVKDAFPFLVSETDID